MQDTLRKSGNEDNKKTERETDKSGKTVFIIY